MLQWISIKKNSHSDVKSQICGKMLGRLFGHVITSLFCFITTKVIFIHQEDSIISDS